MTTYLIRLSRAVNRRVTGEMIMLCATAYEREWSTFIRVVDFCFSWKHPQHCELCFRYELRDKMRYHEYMLEQLRKERDMNKQGELFPPPVNCCYCGKLVPQPFFVVKHFGHMTSQLAFCNESESQKYYLEQLRERGL